MAEQGQERCPTCGAVGLCRDPWHGAADRERVLVEALRDKAEELDRFAGENEAAGGEAARAVAVVMRQASAWLREAAGEADG